MLPDLYKALLSICLLIFPPKMLLVAQDRPLCLLALQHRFAALLALTAAAMGGCRVVLSPSCTRVSSHHGWSEKQRMTELPFPLILLLVTWEKMLLVFLWAGSAGCWAHGTAAHLRAGFYSSGWEYQLKQTWFCKKFPGSKCSLTGQLVWWQEL